MLPTRPGFYWAIWTSPADGTHEAEEWDFSVHGWAVVEVWRNCPVHAVCEADAEEEFGVSVCGVRETQWLSNFTWGGRVSPFAEVEQCTP